MFKQRRRYQHSLKNYPKPQERREGRQEQSLRTRVAVARFTHACQDSLVGQSFIERVPYLGATVYLCSGEAIGKVEDIFGAVPEFSILVRLHNPMSIWQFGVGIDLYVDGQKLLPLERFTQSKGNARSKQTSTLQAGGVSSYKTLGKFQFTARACPVKTSRQPKQKAGGNNKSNKRQQ